MSTWLESARERLADQGCKAGGARTAVIEELAEKGGCVDADELSARLREGGRRAGTASVYRALTLLEELGLVHRTALPGGAPARYELVHPDGHHHHHIVCGECGKTVAFSDEELERAVHAISERADFEVVAHDVTLHGTCARCAEPAS